MQPRTRVRNCRRVEHFAVRAALHESAFDRDFSFPFLKTLSDVIHGFVNKHSKAVQFIQTFHSSTPLANALQDLASKSCGSVRLRG